MSESLPFGVMTNCAQIMDKVFLWGGRVLFLALMVTQCLFLASYPAIYSSNLKWYLTILSYAPSVLMWLFLLLFKKAKLLKLRWLFVTWGLYVLGLVVSTAVVFAKVGDSLDKEKFLGPNVLKMVLCITPLLLLLLLNTAEDVKDHKELVPSLCFQMAVDLFDAVEIIDIILEEKERSYGIPKGFGIAMVVLACISFLLSPWQMAENDLGKGKLRRRTAKLRYIVEIIVENLAFLVIRLVIVFKYKKDESIFIAKNGIAFVLGFMRIRDLKDGVNSREGTRVHEEVSENVVYCPTAETEQTWTVRYAWCMTDISDP